jgi:hypothetical protein
MELVRRGALPQILSTFPFGEDARMDDLRFSVACARAGVPLMVVPLVVDEQMQELPMRGVGACYVEDHYTERDRLCRELFVGFARKERAS